MTRMPAVPASAILKLQFPSAKFTQEFTGLLNVYEYHVSDSLVYDPECLNGCSSWLNVVQCFSAVLL